MDKMLQDEAQSNNTSSRVDSIPNTSRPPPSLPSTNDGTQQQSDTNRILTAVFNNQKHQQGQLTYLLERLNHVLLSPTTPPHKDINETRLIQRMDEFTLLAQNLLSWTSSGKCTNCGYCIGHATSYTKHKTCICKLLTQKSVCCLDGYATTMEQIPCLGFVTPFPKFLTWEVDSVMNQGSEPVIRRSTEAHQEFLSTCNEVRKKIASDSINPTARLTISIED